MESSSSSEGSNSREIVQPRRTRKTRATSAKAPAKKRRTTYDIRKQQKSDLVAEVARLEKQLELLKHRILLQQGEANTTIRRTEAANSVLHESAREQHVAIAGIQGMLVSHMQQTLSSLHPTHSFIRLGTDRVERRATLMAMKGQKLREAKRFVEAWDQDLDTESTVSQENRFESLDGGFSVVRFDNAPLPSTTVKAVFDAITHSMQNAEIIISELFGSITIREDTEFEAADISQLRLVSSTSHGATVESNSVVFAEFVDTPEECFGIVVADFVDADELYPYRPAERKMTKSVTLLFAHGAGFCKEIWEPITRRLKEYPLLLNAAVDVEFVNFDFKYHGSNRDETEAPRVDLSNPTAPRVSNSSGDLTTWTTTEVLQRVETLKTKSPDRLLIGIGHSMGACALWSTEVQQPGTFAGLVLFEPVYGDMNVDHVTNFLVSITLQRQSSWPTHEAAEQHLRNFINFSAWDRESLEAYIKGGLVENASTGETELACSPPVEASLYCSKLMFCSDEQLARVKCRVVFHSGGRSKMFLPSMFKDMNEKWPHIYAVGEPIPRSSHVMIMEKPAAVAQKVIESLTDLEPFRSEAATEVQSRL
ncbi:Serine protease [Phytophthora cinnamomi]|uniref:Serine protease n=1 Tax=Phytophthora cinnamomi TaxID=4785 RepID=UPI003559D067|nr:Serine protease [Phytophthora cinnamomi]